MAPKTKVARKVNKLFVIDARVKAMWPTNAMFGLLLMMEHGTRRARTCPRKDMVKTNAINEKPNPIIRVRKDANGKDLVLANVKKVRKERKVTGLQFRKETMARRRAQKGR